MALTASLGFEVVPLELELELETNDSNMSRTSTTISEEGGYATASGGSEGFRSAYTSPVTAQRTAIGDAGPSPTVSVDSASFHTPEPYLSSSQEDEHVSITVEIPDLADSHNRNRYETDQPKLLLADDGVEGTEGKQPLNNEYNGRRAGNYPSKSQGSSRRGHNEATPLLQSESKDCCLLL